MLKFGISQFMAAIKLFPFFKNKSPAFGILFPVSILTISLGGFLSEYRHPVWYGKTRMVWVPNSKTISKISLFVLTECTDVTDRQTPS